MHSTKFTQPKAFFGLLAACVALSLSFANAQIDLSRPRDPIPAKVEQAFERGLRHLAASQQPKGNWKDSHGSKPGVVGLAVVAMLAHGEDPRFGPFREPIRKSIHFLIDSQDEKNGYIGDSMYHHGFATLALAESYGTVDDERLGQALKKAIDLILAAQEQNPEGAWRYNPSSRDADTTVTGAQMVALFAARNAGIAVPESAITKGLRFYESCFTPGGGFGYSSSSGPNMTRSAIGTLVYSLARQENRPAARASLDYLKQDLEYRDSTYPFYYEYYMAQALYQADPETWQVWNRLNTDYIISIQGEDGSWDSNHGQAFATAAALLSLALNYRLLPIYER